MPNQRTITTLQGKVVVPMVTVVGGVVKWGFWTMNKAQLVQMCQEESVLLSSFFSIPRAPSEHDRENISVLNEGRETGYELGKRHSTTNKINDDPPERACMLRENQSTETIINFTSDEEYVSCEEEESLIENDSDQTEEREPSSSMSTTDTSDKEEEESSTTKAYDKEEESETHCLSEDTDGSVHERCLLISSRILLQRE